MPAKAEGAEIIKALITGTSSEISRNMARTLSHWKYDLILIARRRERLGELQHQLPSQVKIICADLRQEQAYFDLYKQTKEENIDILINNIDFGFFGSFVETDLHRELELLDVNVHAVHIPAKLFLRDFLDRDSGYALDVASTAAFLPGPLLSSYYASKARVLRLTQTIGEELRRRGSHVHIGALCPGPVDTEFDRVADMHFSIRSMSSQRVVMVVIQQMFSRQPVIMPDGTMKAMKVLVRAMPDALLFRISYHLQKRKQGPKSSQVERSGASTAPKQEV